MEARSQFDELNAAAGATRGQAVEAISVLRAVRSILANHPDKAGDVLYDTMALHLPRIEAVLKAIDSNK